MADVESVEKCVKDYETTYRHPDLPQFTVNRLYDLPVEWQENTFPDADGRGVYVFYDEDKKLSYIGKASWNNTLGARIADYFRRDPDSVLKPAPGHNWTRFPRFVQTIRVSEGFEAPSLEEYLVTTLRPVDNTLK
jgi:hypothetical protein